VSRRKRKREEREALQESLESTEDAKPSALGTIGAMLGLGVVLGWASVFAIPWFEGLGVAPHIATNFPFAAFALGAAWGLALRTSKGARGLLTLVAAPIVTGVIFYFFGLFGGALLLLFGASERVADYAPLGGFVLGVALGCLPVVAVILDGIQRVLSKAK
jgi:hypothetical protein